MMSARRVSIVAALLAAVAPVIGGAAHAQTTPSGGLALGPFGLAGDEPSYLDFGAGAFDIQSHRESSPEPEGRIEFRYGKKLFYLGPAIGLLGTTQGGIFGYAGIYADLAFGRFVLTPLAAAGVYHHGGGEDLGGVFQFRLSADLAYAFDNQTRLGVQFAHISSASINNRNPGDNELLLTYAIPLSLPF